MNRQMVAASLLLVLLSGCTSMRAPSRQGLIAMEGHRCQEAIGVMQGPAAQGDGYSINNLGTVVEAGCPEAGWPPDPVGAFSYYERAAERGVPIAFSNAGALLEFGKITGEAEPEAAAVLYREGARYGDDNAIKGLERLGQPVPAIDRVAPDIAERRKKQLDFALLVAGVMVDTPAPSAPSRPLLPVPQRVGARIPPTASPSVTPFVAPPGASAKQAVMPARAATPAVPPARLSLAETATCRNATDCGTGKSCVIPNGQVTGLGVCATPTKGVMAIIPTPRLMPLPVDSCQFDTQCPAGFKCTRVSPGDLNGLCVGPTNATTLLH